MTLADPHAARPRPVTRPTQSQVGISRRNRAFGAVGLFEAFTGFERVLASTDADTRVVPEVNAGR